MSHVYVVTSNSYTPGPADPLVTIVGTVDGVPVTVTLWLSAYNQALAINLAALEALVAPIMLAQAIINAPPPPVVPVKQITGTFVM
jgi:energy-converting hydrogenase Eha subunit E